MVDVEVFRNTFLEYLAEPLRSKYGSMNPRDVAFNIFRLRARAARSTSKELGFWSNRIENLLTSTQSGPPKPLAVETAARLTAQLALLMHWARFEESVANAIELKGF